MNIWLIMIPLALFVAGGNVSMACRKSPATMPMLGIGKKLFELFSITNGIGLVLAIILSFYAGGAWDGFIIIVGGLVLGGATGAFFSDKSYSPAFNIIFAITGVVMLFVVWI